MSDSPRWLSTSEAAALLGVSPKTVWRRARAGKLTARKAAGERGAMVWEIAVDASGQPTGQTDRPTGQKQAANRPDNRPQSPEIEREASGQSNRTPTGQPAKATGQSDGASGGAAAGERLVEARGEIAFLRGVIEQLQRDGAETRAALREALKSRPKQLTAGDASATARDGPGRAQSGEMGDHSPKPAKESHGRAGAQESALSYGDIADQLDAMLEGRNP